MLLLYNATYLMANSSSDHFSNANGHTMATYGIVEILLVILAIQTLRLVGAVAPADRHGICRTDFRYRALHDRIPYANDTSSGTWRMLLDQNDYQNIIGGFPTGVWTARDFDGDGRTVISAIVFRLHTSNQLSYRMIRSSSRKATEEHVHGKFEQLVHFQIPIPTTGSLRRQWTT